MSDEINTILLQHQLNYSLWQVLYVIQLKQGCTSIDIGGISQCVQAIDCKTYSYTDATGRFGTSRY